MEDKLKEFARLQQHVRDDPTDWQAFFAAGHLWEEIAKERHKILEQQLIEEEQKMLAYERQISEHQDQGFWTRLRTRITKRGQRT